MAIASLTLRYIAGCEIDKILPGLSTQAREEYITSIVRQWRTNEYHAGVFTVAVNYWLNLVELDGKVHAGREVCPSDLSAHLGRWLVVERDLPGIVHQLTIAQSVTFVNAEGVTVRVSAEPKEHIFRYEEVKDEDSE